MKLSTQSLIRVHPMVIFWIGVLTGALIVGFVFLYNSLQNSHYQDSSIGTPTNWKR